MKCYKSWSVSKSWVTEKQINNEIELDKWVPVDVLRVLHLDTRIVFFFQVCDQIQFQLETVSFYPAYFL